LLANLTVALTTQPVGEDDVNFPIRTRTQPGRTAGADLGFGLALVMVVIGVAPTAGRSQPDLKISVRVYNYAQVPSRTLASAEAEARRILNAAGVDALWHACYEPRVPSQSVAEDCAGPYGGATVVLRILPGPPPAKAVSSEAVFGLAMGNSVASIFYGRITEMAHYFRGYDSDVAVFLGNAITHELGHLLLGPGHSATGIMSADWESNDLRSALMGHQSFTSGQSKQIRRAVSARTNTEPEQLASAGTL
jgi:hypothetical protein